MTARITSGAFSRTARCVLLALLLCAAAPGQPTAEQNRPKIGLVLGGGGARGAAHIGVIRVLEELRVPVDLIVGTSMGSIIGGLYASGYDADEMEAILESIDWGETLRDTPRRSEQPMRRKEEDLELAVRYRLGLGLRGPKTPPGAIEGQHLQALLRRTLLPVHGIDDFDDLPIPFRAVATDLATGDVVVIGQGDLALAIRSSMSVPGAFSPVKFGDRIYVDGGVVDNVPVDVARELGMDVLLAIDVSSELSDLDADASALSVSLRATGILLKNRTETILSQLTDADVFVRVDLGRMSGSDFANSTAAIPKGEAAARAASEEFARYSVGEDEYAIWKSAHVPPGTGMPLIREILVDASGDPKSADVVRAPISQRSDSALDLARLERDLDRIYAIGRHSLVDYSLDPNEDGSTDLVVRPHAKSWGPTLLRFGLNISEDFQGGSRYQFRVETLTHGLNRRGLEWRNRVDIGTTSQLRTELFQPIDLRARWFLAGYASARQSAYTFGIDGTRVAQFSYDSVDAGLALGRNLGQANEIRAGVRMGHSWLHDRIVLPGLLGFNTLDATRGQLTALIAHDTLDDFSLPSSGNRSVVQALWSRTELASDYKTLLIAGQSNQAFHFGRHCFLLGASGGGRVHGPASESETTFLGGQFRLSGLYNDELVADRFALGRLVYYNHHGLEDAALIGAPLYYGFSAEAGQTWLSDEVPYFDELRYAGSIFVGFDTLLGPVFLGYGRAEFGRQSMYFSLGPLFGFGRERLFGDP